MVLITLICLLFTANSVIQHFVPTYVRNSLPSRLIKIRTMTLVSGQSQEICDIVSEEVHSQAIKNIRNLVVGIDFDDVIRYLKKAIGKMGLYAILSHRWGTNEVTFEDINLCSEILTGGIMDIKSECVKNRKYFKTKSILNTLVTESRKNDPHLDPENHIIKHLFDLVNSIDLKDTNANVGFVKLVNYCHVALFRHGCEFAWMDTCCIDKTSSAELDESIRSMFKWYRNSAICIIHLGSTSKGAVRIKYDPWFSRGWTLQELLAPRRAKFYDEDWLPFTGWRVKNDKLLQSYYPTETDDSDPDSSKSDIESDDEDEVYPGILDHRINKRVLLHSGASEVPLSPGAVDREIHEQDVDERLIKNVASITGIPLADLLHFKPGLKDIRRRLQWAANRETTRIEDRAYSLLGIFGITIPIAYGEGENAFYRLQESIMQKSSDRSLFLWEGQASSQSSMLASTPECFKCRYDILTKNAILKESYSPQPYFTLTNHGLAIAMSLYDNDETIKWANAVASDYKLGLAPNRVRRYRLAVLGYDNTSKPIYMILVKHRRLGNIYYTRHLWSPQSIRGVHLDMPQPPDAEVIFIQ